MQSVILCTAILLTANHLASVGDPAAGWGGQKVMPKVGAIVRVDDGTIQWRSIGILPWVVQEVKGELLKVGESEKGWVEKDDVVLLDEAVAYYTQVLSTGDTSVYGNRASAFCLTGFPDLAIADYGEMLRLHPTASGYIGRGHVWGQKKEYEKALSDFNSAIQLDPNESTPYNNIAWIRATSSIDKYLDGNEAVELATKACEKSGWTSAYYCGTLGAAYAESGDFDAALKYQAKAIELNKHDVDFVKRAEARITLYKNHRPYREK